MPDQPVSTERGESEARADSAAAARARIPAAYTESEAKDEVIAAARNCPHGCAAGALGLLDIYKGVK